MTIDVDTLTTVGAVTWGEYRNHVHAWPGATPRIVINVMPLANGAIVQFGYNGNAAVPEYWTRARQWSRANGWADWTPWSAFMPFGPPPDAGGAPVPVAAYINEASDVVIVFSRALDPANVPARSAFTVMSDGNSLNTLAIAVSGDTVTIQIGASGANVTTSYAQPGTKPLQSIDAVLVESFANYPVETAGKAITV